MFQLRFLSAPPGTRLPNRYVSSAALVRDTSRSMIGASNGCIGTLRVTKWTPVEVVAEDDSPRCFAYTLTINVKRKAALMFRRPKGGAYCKRFKSKAQILELVDGFKVAFPYDRKVVAKR